MVGGLTCASVLAPSERYSNRKSIPSFITDRLPSLCPTDMKCTDSTSGYNGPYIFISSRSIGCMCVFMNVRRQMHFLSSSIIVVIPLVLDAGKEWSFSVGHDCDGSYSQCTHHSTSTHLTGVASFFSPGYPRVTCYFSISFAAIGHRILPAQISRV